MTALVTKPIGQLHLAPGSVVTIPDVTWSEFEAILTERAHRSYGRIAYYQGTLEIMVPLPEHERPKELISDIVKALLKKQRIPYEPFGSTTFKQLGTAGIEPDACFYIQNASKIIGRRRLQPGDPPPDLAIESDVTSKTTIDAYTAIGVPEVWIFDNGNLKIFALQAGSYIETNVSPTFPNISIIDIVTKTVDRSWKIGSYQAMTEFEETVLTTL
ncbi:MAG: Uma2 family endonuclease [Leptolyngbyaceae cyanobacterium MAG.088]|nr:Uma2 family endonuclease [Leptolyngbyaceae cyanobacterium MAG.088]